jgi:hypothetical protein
MGTPRQLAYFAPDWIWPTESIEFMKLMLLFFDGITLSVPQVEFEETVNREPVLALPLCERGLLHNLDPSDYVDPVYSELLSSAVIEAVTMLDYKEEDKDRFLTLTYHHAGKLELPEGKSLAAAILNRGLGSYPSGPSRMFQVTPAARWAILYLFGQALRCSVKSNFPELRVEPVLPNMVDYQQFNSTSFPGNDIAFRKLTLAELEISDNLWVPLDLERVPLDELLDMKRAYAPDLRAYLEVLKEFKLNLSASSDPTRLIEERLHEISDYASGLRARDGVNRARATVSFMLSLVGATWTAWSGDIAGSIFALLAAAAGLPRNDAPRDVTSYSYLMKVRHRPRW